MGSGKLNTKNELIYVLAGKEEASVNVQCKKLLDQLLEPEQRATGLFNVEPARLAVSDVLDELRTLPFLTERRVVLIKGADDFVSQNRQSLEKYFDNPSATGVLVLTVTSWPATTRLAKKLSRVGKLISVTAPKRGQLPYRLIEYSSDVHDKNLTRTAAELLIELSGDNIARLYSEIDKLALFAHTEKTIKPSHVESLIGHNRLFNCFAVIDSVIAGNVGCAVNRLRKMFAEDRTAEFTVVGAFAFHFRRMFGAKVLLEKGVGAGEIAGRMRIWSNKERFFAELRQMSLRQIGENLERLASVDYAIKTGRTKARVAMEQLIFDMAAGPGKRVVR